MKYLSIAFILWGFQHVGVGQDWSKYGYDAFEEKDYYGAAHYFEKYLKIDSSQLDIRWTYAQSERFSNQYSKAAIAYKAVMEKDVYLNYPNAVFYRADMLKRMERYQEAESYFEFYQEICKDRANLLFKRAKIEIKACQSAQALAKAVQPFTITHPPLELNSYSGEFSHSS